MSTLFIFSSDAKKFWKTAARFCALLLIAYLAALLTLSTVRRGERPLVSYLLDEVISGGAGHTLQRFREASHTKEVDILFLGSSHAYRSFDPRIFDAAGHRTFNMGSKSQTPLNSYYLLKHYLPSLRPKVVVYECNFYVLESEDGFESLRDLIVNLPLSKDIFLMAAASRSPRAVNWVLSEFFGRLTVPLEKREQQTVDDQAYIPGGYVETTLTSVGKVRVAPRDLKLSTRQLKYLERIARMCAEYRTKVIFVVQPLPKERLERMSNYERPSGQIKKLAFKLKVEYHDFNELMILDSKLDYMDDDHLNAEGVKKFDKRFLELPSLARKREEWKAFVV